MVVTFGKLRVCVFVGIPFCLNFAFRVALCLCVCQNSSASVLFLSVRSIVPRLSSVVGAALKGGAGIAVKGRLSREVHTGAGMQPAPQKKCNNPMTRHAHHMPRQIS